VRSAWVRDFGEFAGERDYAPGYAWLLEGDLVFGDPQTDADNHALRALVQDAQQLDALIMPGSAVADASTNAQERTE
jgi:exodeoxyribonuclease V gamma subunit